MIAAQFPSNENDWYPDTGATITLLMMVTIFIFS